jgi:hypothetical protein
LNRRGDVARRVLARGRRARARARRALERGHFHRRRAFALRGRVALCGRVDAIGRNVILGASIGTENGTLPPRFRARASNGDA